VRHDHLDIPIVLELLINAIAIVNFISNHSTRYFTERPCSEALFDKHHFMWRSADYVYGDGTPEVSATSLILRPFSPLVFQQRFFCRIKCPADEDLSEFNIASFIDISASKSKIWSKTPFFR